jgi:3-oxoacyl-[acyl-carrier-protein] synthase-1
VAGVPEIDVEARIDRKQLRFMGDAAAYAQIALEDAIAQAGLTPEQVSHPRTGLIMGSGGGSPANQIEAADTLREKGIRRVGPYQVTRCMSSTVSACLATNFKVKGINYSITSACSTSAHCIGAAAQQIAWGMQDVMFAGGGEELSWGMALLFDGMGAMSSKYNDQPEKASRAYDANRDGFVIAGGGGAVVLESLEHAQARGARILAEVVGFGATSDGEDMVAPSGDGAIACMQQALEGIEGGVDYINTHGTSTPLGDGAEIKAIEKVFGAHAEKLNISSTKSMTGHLLGGAGGIEAVACILAMQHGLVPPTINLHTPDPEINQALNFTPNVAQERDVRVAMSNTFGFGGHNTSVIFRKL